MSKARRPPVPPRGEAVTIRPGAYPVLPSSIAMHLVRAIRDPKVAAAAEKVIADSADDLRSLVLKNIDGLEAAARGNDAANVYHQAHEIRGVAGNAGLPAAAKIANGLCIYLDAFSEAQKAPETAVIRLHVDAIARAARAEDEATRLGDAVAAQLAVLVSKKLTEINQSEIAAPGVPV